MPWHPQFLSSPLLTWVSIIVWKKRKPLCKIVTKWRDTGFRAIFFEIKNWVLTSQLWSINCHKLYLSPFFRLLWSNICSMCVSLFISVIPLSVKPTKWSSTLKRFLGKLSTNCFSVFDHFVGLALKELIAIFPWTLVFDSLKIVKIIKHQICCVKGNRRIFRSSSGFIEEVTSNFLSSYLKCFTSNLD